MLKIMKKEDIYRAEEIKHKLRCLESRKADIETLRKNGEIRIIGRDEKVEEDISIVVKDGTKREKAALDHILDTLSMAIYDNEISDLRMEYSNMMAKYYGGCQKA